MLLEVLRLALVLGLLVVLPGIVLVNALLPPRVVRLGVVPRGYLAIAGGVLALMLVGVILGFLPHGDRGWFQTSATGTPNVEVAMLAVTVVLFYVGLQRGAYPVLAARFPRLARPDGRSI